MAGVLSLFQYLPDDPTTGSFPPEITVSYFNTSGADIAAEDTVAIALTSAVAGLGGEITVGPAVVDSPIVGVAKALIVDGEQGEVVLHGVVVANVNAGVAAGDALVQSAVAGRLITAVALTDQRAAVAITAAGVPGANQAVVYVGI